MVDERTLAITMLEEAEAFERTAIYRRMAAQRAARREDLVKQLIVAALGSPDLRLRAFAHQVQQSNLDWAEFEEIKDEGTAVLDQKPAETPRSEYSYEPLG